MRAAASRILHNDALQGIEVADVTVISATAVFLAAGPGVGVSHHP